MLPQVSDGRYIKEISFSRAAVIYFTVIKVNDFNGRDIAWFEWNNLSIQHYLYLLILAGFGVAEVYPSTRWAKGGHTLNRSPIYLACMSGLWEEIKDKPMQAWRGHANTNSQKKLRTLRICEGAVPTARPPACLELDHVFCYMVFCCNLHLMAFFTV